MENDTLEFVILYGAIAVAELGLVLHYWYNQLHKKQNHKNDGK